MQPPPPPLPSTFRDRTVYTTRRGCPTDLVALPGLPSSTCPVAHTSNRIFSRTHTRLLGRDAYRPFRDHEGSDTQLLYTHY